MIDERILTGKRGGPVLMARICDRDDELLLVDCDCGNIIADAPDAELVQCHDCGRRYRVWGGCVFEEVS